MAEVGLLPFARVALQVATQVLPPYRTRFSKHPFTQPQLLAVLCLIVVDVRQQILLGSLGAGVRRAFFAGVARCGGTRRSDR
jgi:hypothetical protein